MIHIEGKNRQETKQLLNSIYKDVYNKKNQNGDKISFSQFNGMLENMSEEDQFAFDKFVDQYFDISTGDTVRRVVE